MLGAQRTGQGCDDKVGASSLEWVRWPWGGLGAVPLVESEGSRAR